MSECRSEAPVFSMGSVAIIVNYSCTLLIYWSGLLMGICFVCVKTTVNNSPLWNSALQVSQTVFPFPATYLYQCQFSIKSCNFIHCNFCVLISIFHYTDYQKNLGSLLRGIIWFSFIMKECITAKEHWEELSLPVALAIYIEVSQGVGRWDFPLRV